MFNNYAIIYELIKYITKFADLLARKIHSVESPFKASFEAVNLNMVRKDLNGGYVTMKLLN
jgi:hypothetical protein